MRKKRNKSVKRNEVVRLASLVNWKGPEGSRFYKRQEQKYS